MSSFKASTWRKFFMENATLKYTDTIIQKVWDTAVPGTEAPKIFETISKNPGIGLLCLDADGDKMIMLHNPGTIGGTWLQDETKLVALLGFDSNPVAVKIKDSSIKDIKQKVPKLEDIQDAIMENISFKNIKGVREILSQSRMH